MKKPTQTKQRKQKAPRPVPKKPVKLQLVGDTISGEYRGVRFMATFIRQRGNKILIQMDGKGPVEEIGWRPNDGGDLLALPLPDLHAVMRGAVEAVVNDTLDGAA